MAEDNERGLGHAYVISDSTFERARRIPAIVLVVFGEIEYIVKGREKRHEKRAETMRETDRDTKIPRMRARRRRDTK